MNSNAISSTTPRNEAAAHLPDVSARARPVAGDSELACLLRLDVLLKTLGQLLADGRPEGLPELSQEASRIAQDISLLYARSPQLAALAGDAERSKLMLELRRKLTFCTAMLRRWRRMLALRQQLCFAASDPATYTPQFLAGGQ